MTQPTQPCPGITVPGTPRPLRRCQNCGHYSWAASGLRPAMQRQSDGTWHCSNEAPVGVVAR